MACEASTSQLSFVKVENHLETLKWVIRKDDSCVYSDSSEIMDLTVHEVFLISFVSFDISSFWICFPNYQVLTSYNIFINIQLCSRSKFLIIAFWLIMVSSATYGYNARFPAEAGADPKILKRGGVLYVGHHGWPTNKVLGFRWSKKAKKILETKAFGETFLLVFSNFLHFYI